LGHLVGLVRAVGRACIRLRVRRSVRGGWKGGVVILGYWARCGGEVQQLSETQKGISISIVPITRGAGELTETCTASSSSSTSGIKGGGGAIPHLTSLLSHPEDDKVESPQPNCDTDTNRDGTDSDNGAIMPLRIARRWARRRPKIRRRARRRHRIRRIRNPPLPSVRRRLRTRRRVRRRLRIRRRAIRRARRSKHRRCARVSIPRRRTGPRREPGTRRGCRVRGREQAGGGGVPCAGYCVHGCECPCWNRQACGGDGGGEGNGVVDCCEEVAQPVQFELGRPPI
jgi:hypothetical protein